MTTHSQLILDVLVRLFVLAERPRDAGALGRQLGSRPTDVARALVHLEARGLVDAGSLRLTLAGLAAGAALHADAQRRSGRHAA